MSTKSNLDSRSSAAHHGVEITVDRTRYLYLLALEALVSGVVDSDGLPGHAYDIPARLAVEVLLKQPTLSDDLEEAVAAISELDPDVEPCNARTASQLAWYLEDLSVRSDG